MTIYSLISLILVSFLLGNLLSLIITPRIRRLGIDLNLFDRFEERKSNKDLKVRIGGVSLLLSFLITIIIVIIVFKQYFNLNTSETDYLVLIILGSIFFSLLGFIDDVKSLSPFIRLFFQFLIAIFISNGGIRIESLTIGIPDIFISEIDLPSFISTIFTSIWIVGLINAFNWLDGLDGLSTSIGIVIALTILIIAFGTNNILLCFMISTLIGSSVGFLKYNIFPSRIIMGDSGSYFIGFLLSIFGIISTYTIDYQTNITLLIFLFLLPLGDMIYVIIKRISQFKSPFFPDRNHIHFRLIDKGYLETKAAKIIIKLSIVNGFISYLISIFTT